MAKALLIAEKPSLMRAAQNAYKKMNFKDDVDFTTFVGHTMTLLAPDEYREDWKKWQMETLPLIPETFIYKPSEDKTKLFNEIKELIKKGSYDYLINCCDPGREGQHIFHSFYQAIGCQLPVKRMWHNDETIKGMQKAFNEMRDDLNDERLVNMTKASQLRSYFDWLIGMNFSRAFSIVGGTKTPIGRVMTPTLRLVVDRELEIKNFKEEKYWTLIGVFEHYEGTYQQENGETRVFDEQQLRQIENDVKGKVGEIVESETERKVKYAPKLYALSDIQEDANEAFGYSFVETLEIIQSLYEGKILSYPRTDSVYITESVADEFSTMLNAIKGISSITSYVEEVLKDKETIKKMSRNKMYVDNSKVSDHYAIVPTGTTFNFESLTKKQQNVLELIAKRLLAIFLPPIQTDKSVILTNVEGHLFKTNGSILVDSGYSVIYETQFKNKTLPNVEKGSKQTLEKTSISQKKTTPPKRYTQATLGKLMKNAGRLVEDNEMKKALNNREGLGTPATRGQIIEKLIHLKMINVIKNQLVATDYGISIIQNLNNHPTTSPELTGKWECKLLQIEACELDADVFYNEMVEYVKTETDYLKQMKFSMDVSEKEKAKTLGTCPCCGSDIIVGQKYYLCQEYKKSCQFIVPFVYFGAKLTEEDVKKIINGEKTKEKTFMFEKEKKIFNSKAKVFYNKETRRLSFDFQNDTPKKTLGNCPKCGKGVYESTNYYLCEGYKKDCDFILNKTICNATITTVDVTKLLKGGTTKPKMMQFKSGMSQTSLKLENGELRFVFENKSKK